MPTKDKSREVLTDIMEGTKKLFSRLREDVDELSSKGKLRMEIMSLKNKRARVFRDLGMRTYVLTKNEKYTIPEVKNLLEEIKQLEDKIDKDEKALKEFLSTEEGKAKKEQKKPAAKKTATKATARKKTSGRKEQETASS